MIITNIIMVTMLMMVIVGENGGENQTWQEWKTLKCIFVFQSSTMPWRMRTTMRNTRWKTHQQISTTSWRDGMIEGPWCCPDWNNKHVFDLPSDWPTNWVKSRDAWAFVFFFFLLSLSQSKRSISKSWQDPIFYIQYIWLKIQSCGQDWQYLI